MINKQNLWFVTLFSLILVLGVYYVTLADEALNVDSIIDDAAYVISTEDSNILTALKVASDEESLEQIAMYEAILLNNSSSVQEKNDAYDSLQNIQSNKAKVEDIETMIKEMFSLEAFVKINSDQISVTIAGKEHSVTSANSIIREIQNMYEVQMYITVKYTS